MLALLVLLSGVLARSHDALLGTPVVVPIDPAPSDDFLILCAEGHPSCDTIWDQEAPPAFIATIPTTQGSFQVFVNTSWAPVFAQRFYTLTLLSYFKGGPFYRVLDKGSQRFVTQFGYRGSPPVDLAWINLRISNATERVLLPNTVGTVAFGTSEVSNSGSNPNCTAPQCSQGFSVELFINTADNSAKLDGMDFSPFGVVLGDGVERVVASLFSGYGECSDLCVQDPSDPYCVRNSLGGFAGVNLTTFLSPSGGWGYLKVLFPLLDSVTT
jgi:hypothetical protein